MHAACMRVHASESASACLVSRRPFTAEPSQDGAGRITRNLIASTVSTNISARRRLFPLATDPIPRATRTKTKASANDGFWTTWMDSNRVSINLFDESVLYHLPASALLSLTHWQGINYLFLYRALYSVLVLISKANSDNSTRMRRRGIDYLKWDVRCEALRMRNVMVSMRCEVGGMWVAWGL